MITTILFDLDGTLYPYEDLTQDLADEAAFSLLPKNPILTDYLVVKKEMDFMYACGQIKHNEYFSRKKRYSLLLKKIKLEDDGLSEKMEVAFLNKIKDTAKPYNGVFSVISELKNKYKIVVATNGLLKYQLLKLHALKLHSLVDVVITSEQAGASKPNKIFFEFILNSLNASAKECVMVGNDLQNDIKCASEAGIEAIFYNPKNIVQTTTNKEFADFKDLLKFL